MFLRDHINRGRIGKLTEFVYFFSNSNSPSLGSPALFCLYSSVLTELGRTLTSCLFTEVPHQGHPLGTYSPSTCNEGGIEFAFKPSPRQWHLCEGPDPCPGTCSLPGICWFAGSPLWVSVLKDNRPCNREDGLIPRMPWFRSVAVKKLWQKSDLEKSCAYFTFHFQISVCRWGRTGIQGKAAYYSMQGYLKSGSSLTAKKPQQEP